ncbi:cation:proton antiporter [soil metagenome]
MSLVLVFAITLLVAVLVSELADRSVLSTAVLFLLTGVAAGVVAQDIPSVDDNEVLVLIEVALFTVLFTDGMRVGLGDLASAWRLPGRALLLGLPLTLFVTALLARLLADLPWGHALLLGAVLAPTDPVFAAAMVGREGVPRRLRRLLNVESGLNDGLALPVVVTLLALLSAQDTRIGELTGELLAGVVVGAVIPWVALHLEASRFFSPAKGLAELFPFAIGLLVFAVASVTHANLFLSAFTAGVTVASVSPGFRETFEPFGQLISELLKVAAIFVFGALLSPSLLADVTLGGYVFALLTLFVARPVAIAVALFGSHISRREWIAAAWFGPKGFASVVYGLLVAHSGIAQGDKLFQLVAVVVFASILLHSSSDVFVARQFRDLQEEAPAPSG